MLTVFAMILLPFICHTQPGIDRLQVPSEYAENGQKIYDSYEYLYNKILEYVTNNEYVTKTGIDSVRQISLTEYINLNPQTRETLSGNNSSDTIILQPQVKKLLDEVSSVIKAYNPKRSPEKLADLLGKINKRASDTLSKTDAVKVFTVTCTSYYSTIYWIINAQKWQQLGEIMKQKTAN